MLRLPLVLTCLTVALLAGCGAGPVPGAAAGSAAQVAIVAPPAIPDAGAPPQAAPAPAPVLSEAEVAAEAERLRAAYAAEVPRRAEDAAGAADWITRARAALAVSDQVIDRPQLLVIVDRNPRVQALRILLARPNGEWEVIGGSRVSTGQTGRFDHYITPVGVFPHTDAILDYRAEGTFNENHIRGLGLHGMRVWDFGWQVASKGWLSNQSGPMRLLMHATDPANLELRIGYRASSGCVRIPAAVNIFLDRHGVLDVDYERVARDDIRYRALLRRDRVPTPLAGDLLIVVDSGDRT